MTLAALRTKFEAIANSGQAVAVMYFLLRSNNSETIKKVELTATAQNDATAVLIGDLKEFFACNYTLRDLTNADQRANYIYRYNLPAVPNSLSLLRSTLNDYGTIIDFDHSVDSVSDLKAIILAIGNGTDTIAVYKHHYPTNTYRRAGFSILRAAANTDRFEKLEQDIVRLSHTIDFIDDGNNFYVANFKILEKFFGFKEAIKKEAATQLSQLAARQLIENIAELSKRVSTIGDVTFAKKIIRALSHSPVLGTVNNDKIIQFVRTHHTLGKKIKINLAGTQFVLDTKISQNFFVKLLNDDFLKSELTNFEYDADSKDIVEAEVEAAATP